MFKHILHHIFFASILLELLLQDFSILTSKNNLIFLPIVHYYKNFFLQRMNFKLSPHFLHLLHFYDISCFMDAFQSQSISTRVPNSLVHIVWKLPKMSHFIFEFWHFSPIFVLLYYNWPVWLHYLTASFRFL